jgi:hypothetical protein
MGFLFHPDRVAENPVPANLFPHRLGDWGDKHLDLVARRLLNEETIPAHEKVFSLFEPHTEWIQKG